MNLCASRACDGVPAKVPVWHDGHGALSLTCPVLALTPEVRNALDWFDQSHERRRGEIVRLGFPAPGAVGQQDARLMGELAIIRNATQRVIDRARQPKPKEAPRG